MYICCIISSGPVNIREYVHFVFIAYSIIYLGAIFRWCCWCLSLIFHGSSVVCFWIEPPTNTRCEYRLIRSIFHAWSLIRSKSSFYFSFYGVRYADKACNITKNAYTFIIQYSMTSIVKIQSWHIVISHVFFSVSYIYINIRAHRPMPSYTSKHHSHTHTPILNLLSNWLCVRVSCWNLL